MGSLKDGKVFSGSFGGHEAPGSISELIIIPIVRNLVIQVSIDLEFCPGELQKEEKRKRKNELLEY